jgi:hypothetical protein
LTIYKEDKEQILTTEGHNKGKLPKSLLPKNKTAFEYIPKDQELTIWIDGNEYPLSQIAGLCNQCGRILPIPDEWLDFFVCSDHAGDKSILRKKRGSEVNLHVSGAEIKDVLSIEAKCRRRTKTGVCGTLFSLGPDFSHQICDRCYDKRKAESKPRYKIPPREDYANSFFYDVNRDQIFEKEKKNTLAEYAENR